MSVLQSNVVGVGDVLPGITPELLWCLVALMQHEGPFSESVVKVEGAGLEITSKVATLVSELCHRHGVGLEALEFAVLVDERIARPHRSRYFNSYLFFSAASAEAVAAYDDAMDRMQDTDPIVPHADLYSPLNQCFLDILPPEKRFHPASSALRPNGLDSSTSTFRRPWPYDETVRPTTLPATQVALFASFLREEVCTKLGGEHPLNSCSLLVFPFGWPSLPPGPESLHRLESTALARIPGGALFLWVQEDSDNSLQDLIRAMFFVLEASAGLKSRLETDHMLRQARYWSAQDLAHELKNLSSPLAAAAQNIRKDVQRLRSVLSSDAAELLADLDAIAAAGTLVNRSAFAFQGFIDEMAMQRVTFDLEKLRAVARVLLEIHARMRGRGEDERGRLHIVDDLTLDDALAALAEGKKRRSRRAGLQDEGLHLTLADVVDSEAKGGDVLAFVALGEPIRNIRRTAPQESDEYPIEVWTKSDRTLNRLEIFQRTIEPAGACIGQHLYSKGLDRVRRLLMNTPFDVDPRVEVVEVVEATRSGYVVVCRRTQVILQTPED